MTVRAALLGALAAAVLAAAPGAASAAPGDLDPSFGGGTGVDFERLGAFNRANAVALQPDGAILLAGSATGGTTQDMAVLRLTPAGVLDTSYGSGTGASLLDFGGDEEANAITLQGDDRILVAGSRLSITKGVVSFDGIVARVRNPDGTLDPTYGGGGGWSLLNGVPNTLLEGVAVDSSGIYAAGVGGGPNSDVVVSRLRDPAGTYDPAFHTNGIVRQDLGGVDTGFGMALDPDGRIVVVGSTGPPVSSKIDLVVLRLLNPAGTPDPAFGGGKPVTVDFGGTDHGRAMLIQPDGKIVVVGDTSGTAPGAVVARLNADGTLDQNFGQGGKVTVTTGGFLDATEVALEKDGKILIAGRTVNAKSGQDFGVARLQPGGALDTTWGKDGVASHDLGATDVPGGMVIDADGRVVVVGSRQSEDGKTSDFAIVRLQGDPKPPEQGGDVGGDSGDPPRCDGKRATIVGTAGRDRLTGTPRADVIVGLGGRDTLNGGGGADLICAGSGDDTVSGGAGNDRILAGAGKDSVSGGDGNDTIFGGDGADRLRGDRGADNLSGQAGGDVLYGGDGRDRLAGGSGDDRLLGGEGRDRLFGGDGRDRLFGGPGADQLFGQAGRDVLAGGPGADAQHP